MAFSAKARISLMARGARFLKETPCTCYRVYLLDSTLVFSLPPDAGQRAQRVCLLVAAIRGLHQTERTLLCMWMVYSRATTSSMALRPCWVLPAVGLLDLLA